MPSLAAASSSLPTCAWARSGTEYCCSRRVVCCLPSSIDSASSSDCLSVETESLSVRERRKLRNARREELIASKENWREEVEKKLDVKPKKLHGWEQQLDTNRLSEQGLRWWMLQVFKNAEKELADYFAKEFPRRFPEEHFEVFVPSVPCGKGGRGGAFFDGRRRLFPCIVLVRCVLNREKYDFFTRTYNVMDFFGHKAGPVYLDRTMPAPVSINQIEEIFEQVRQADAAWKAAEEDRQKQDEEKAAEKERKKEAAKVQAAERRMQAKLEQERKKLRKEYEPEWGPEPEVVFKPYRVGSKIMATAGPFQDFKGIVVQTPKKGEKVKVYFTMFGREQAAAVDPSQIVEISEEEPALFE